MVASDSDRLPAPYGLEVAFDCLLRRERNAEETAYVAGYTRSDMGPAPAPQEPGNAPSSEEVAFPPIFRFLSAAFILSFFALFSYSGLFAPLNFDDGTAVVANLEHFDVPMWRNFLRILTVFTTAYRPLATLFWRPMYAVFGFNPL